MDYSTKELPNVRVTNNIIGHGSLSIILEGKTHDNKKVAVKFINPDKYTRKDFYNEIQIYKNLGGRYVPRLISYDLPDVVEREVYHKANRDYVIAIEYVSGINLNVLKNKSKPKDVITFIVSSFIRAVSFLHSNGVYHRDINLSNAILSNTSMGIKLIDFGVSCLYLKHKCLNKYGSILSYSPELGRAISGDVEIPNIVWERADAWALGLAIYEFINGDAYYKNVSIISMLNGDFVFKYGVPHLNSGIPPVDAVVEGLLTINPDERLTIAEALSIMDDDYVCKLRGKIIPDIELRKILSYNRHIDVDKLTSYEACRELNDIDIYNRYF